MKKIIFFSIVILVFLFSTLTLLASENENKLDVLLKKEFLTSAEIIQNADILDGKHVILRGEVIGESLERKDFCWINVYDNENGISIGVLTNLEMISEIKNWGSYKITGDTVDIFGIVYRADPFADGELDFHAEKINIVKSIPSGVREISIPLWKIILAIILFGWLIFILAELTLKTLRKKKEMKDAHILEGYIEEVNDEPQSIKSK